MYQYDAFPDGKQQWYMPGRGVTHRQNGQTKRATKGADGNYRYDDGTYAMIRKSKQPSA